MDVVRIQEVETVVKTMAKVAIENEAYFCELDGVMGDADFGNSLASGYRAVLEQWDAFDRREIGGFLTGVASVIIANTGGCSGPIWGTLFLRSGLAAKGKQELTLADLIVMLRGAIEGIMKRGGAELGDKTLLDALEPAKHALEATAVTGGSLKEAIDAAAKAATQAKETTKGLAARRGRQSFTGDRSIGTYDPGIVAVGMMAAAIAEALQ